MELPNSPQPVKGSLGHPPPPRRTMDRNPPRPGSPMHSSRPVRLHASPSPLSPTPYSPPHREPESTPEQNPIAPTSLCPYVPTSLLQIISPIRRTIYPCRAIPTHGLPSRNHTKGRHTRRGRYRRGKAQNYTQMHSFRRSKTPQIIEINRVTQKTSCFTAKKIAFCHWETGFWL